MVAICNIEEFNQNPKTLGDWVKDFRLKKIQMKRKYRSGGNLRVCAILSSALMSAELELERKQKERFQKWLEFQKRIEKNYELQPKYQEQCIQQNDGENEKTCKQDEEEIANLWKCELSDLDNFMRSISNSSNKENQLHSIRVSS